MEIEGRSRSCIMIGKNVVSYSASTESTCTPDTVLHYVQNVKAVRAFGAMLDLDSGVLNKIEKDPRDSITLIVTEWFNKRVNMSDSDRWEELAAVLMAPIVFEPEIARKSSMSTSTQKRFICGFCNKYGIQVSKIFD